MHVPKVNACLHETGALLCICWSAQTCYMRKDVAVRNWCHTVGLPFLQELLHLHMKVSTFFCDAQMEIGHQHLGPSDTMNFVGLVQLLSIIHQVEVKMNVIWGGLTSVALPLTLASWSACRGVAH